MDGFCVGFGSGAQSAFQPVGLVSSLQRSSARHGSQSPRPSSWVGFRSFIRPLFTHSLKFYPVMCMKWIEHVFIILLVNPSQISPNRVIYLKLYGVKIFLITPK